MPEDKRPLLQWELVQADQQPFETKAAPHLFRLKVPGGWLVTGTVSTRLVYVPDPEHAWLSSQPTPSAP